MAQTQNQNIGPVIVNAVLNGTTTTTYSGDYSFPIEITISGTNFAGVLGYFADNANTGTKVGYWDVATSSLQTAWSVCPASSNYNQLFTHTSTWSAVMPTIAATWNLPEMNLTLTGSGQLTFIKFPFGGTLYWIADSSDQVTLPPTAAQVIAGKNASDVPAEKAGNVVVTANQDKTFSVSGLTPNVGYAVWYVLQVSNAPTVSFQAYFIQGTRGTPATEQFYRTVASDTTTNLKLMPSNPLNLGVSSSFVVAGAGSLFGPSMLLLAFGMWISCQL
jgi:hypothetical protein